MTRHAFAALLVGAIASIVPVAARQTADAVLRIVDPEPNAPIAGPVTLRADVAPQGTAVRRMDFFVDGALICRVERPPFECEFEAGSEVKARLVRVTATLSSGERLVQTVRTGVLTIAERTATNAVLVPVVVTDRDDKFVKGLTAADFRVTEDDVPQTITFLQSEDVPLEIAIAVDVSGSMNQVLPTVRAAVRRFMNNLKPVDRVTLLAFNDRTFVLARREANADVRARALDRLTASGGTALYDAIVASLDQIGGTISRRALIVFTDGADTRSLASRDPVERRILESDATVYVITHGTGESVDSVRRQTRRLAEVSGGRAFPVNRLDEVERAFDIIRDDLESQYLIGYQPMNSVHDGSIRRLRVTTINPNYRIRARESYRASAP